MDDKGVPIILVSLAILFVPVKSGAQNNGTKNATVSEQLELIRVELAQQGRRISAIEQSIDNGRRTPGYNVVSPATPERASTPAGPTTAKPAGKTYTVRLGDSLSIIARRNGVTIADIVKANDLPSADKIKIGQRLIIPEKSEPEPEPTPAPTPETDSSSLQLPPPPQTTTSAHTHELQSGETLFSVARRYKVKVADIQAHNGIADPTTVWAGQVLRIPGTVAPQKTQQTASANPTTSPTTSTRGDKEGKHTVIRGESLIKIAKAHGVPVADLQSLNGINDPNQIFVGQTLLLPGSGPVAKKISAKSTSTKVAGKTPPTPAKPKAAPRTENLGVDDFMGYYVVKGDTVESIASIFNTSPSDLRRINDMPAGTQFKAGEQILVPAGSVFSS